MIVTGVFFLLIMQNYQLEVYVISMEFLAVNSRNDPQGPGAMRGGCIRRLQHFTLYKNLHSGGEGGEKRDGHS